MYYQTRYEQTHVASIWQEIHRHHSSNDSGPNACDYKELYTLFYFYHDNSYDNIMPVILAFMSYWNSSNITYDFIV